MAENYPEDEFDRLAAERTTTGAHRRPTNARPWLLALLAVLIVAPIAGILIGNAMSGGDSPAPEETTSAPADGAVEPDGEGTDAEATEAGEDDATGEDSVEPTEDPLTDDSDTGEPVADADMNHQILVLNGRGTAGFAGENQAVFQDQGFGNVIVAVY